MNSDESKLIEQLPDFETAQKLSIKEYYKYANGFFEYRAYCATSSVAWFEKVYRWCLELNCVDDLSKCRIPRHPLEITSSTAVPITTTTIPSTTTSYLEMVNAVGNNGTCYDVFFCQPKSLTPYLHSFLGLASLTICLIGILFTIILIPPLNIAINRTGATLYLTVMAICDIIYMLLFTLIIVIRHLPVNYLDQLEMYARFTVFLVPHGLPTMEMMELFSVWITVALLVDRFLYLKLGFHSKLIYSRVLSIKITAVVLFFLTVYTIPKYLEYELINYPKYGMMKVRYTKYGNNESFQNLLLHWLKVPLEMFLPYLAVAIFSVIDSIKFYDLMFKKKLQASAVSELQKNETNIKNGTDDQVYNTNNMTTNKNNGFKLPTINITSTQPLLSNNLKSLEDRENLNVIVTLIIGFSMLAFKVPKFILHALKSERYVEETTTKYFQPVTDFLDLIWTIIRPLIYLTIASHFRAAFLSVYCCDSSNRTLSLCYDSSEASTNQNKEKDCVINLDEVANEFVNKNNPPIKPSSIYVPNPIKNDGDDDDETTVKIMDKKDVKDEKVTLLESHDVA